MSSQTHQPAAGPTCPSCAEPLEQGDRFCGACGHDLSAVSAPPGADRPTLAIGMPAGPPVNWPTVTGSGGPGGPPPVPPHGGPPGTDPYGGQPPPPPRPDVPPSPGHGGPGYTQPPGGAPHGAAYPGSPTGPGAGQPYPPAGPYPPHSGHQPGAGPGGGDFELPPPPPSTPPVTPQVAADPRAVDPPPVPTPPYTKVCVACRAGHVDTDGYCENCGHAQPRERDHIERELGSVAAVSDRGLRHHRNEDAFTVSSTALPDGSPAVIAIVCDGVSSATRPDEASQAAAVAANELLLETLPRGTHPQQAMREAILAAGAAVNALAGRDPQGDTLEDPPHHQLNAPACTIVGAISAGGLLIIGWIGDSRVYWVPDDRSAQAVRLTEDDSWAAQMVAAGLMSEAEAYADDRAHAITGWLGADAYDLDPHTAAFQPDHPGVVVVCTDGLWNYAEAADDMARAIPADATDRPLHSAQVLVGHALDGGGHDNVTVAVLPFAVVRQGAGSAYDAYHQA
ncbi:PP2C family serine/threonine-protein phosphatase [Streptomyces sp. NPDC020965]|uniref:PP2C family serine/threonine-protein phosphatase n=1 Tax=Streptomyces sp. NPDC020965 TaxID=3365105 RepID=UPI0037AACB0E